MNFTMKSVTNDEAADDLPKVSRRKDDVKRKTMTQFDTGEIMASTSKRSKVMGGGLFGKSMNKITAGKITEEKVEIEEEGESGVVEIIVGGKKGKKKKKKMMRDTKKTKGQSDFEDI